MVHTLVLKQPHSGGGVSLSDIDSNIKPNDYLLANVPIYGTKAAGRGLYFRVRALVLEEGLQENFIFAAFYHYSIDGEILIMLGTHVDDMLYGHTAAGEKIMNRIIEKLEVGSQADQEFRFVGRNFRQDPETFKIHVSSAENTKKIEPIKMSAHRATQTAMPCTDEEKSQLRSNNGSTSWLIRAVRPEHLYDCSVLQQCVNNAYVSDLHKANNLTEKLKEDPYRGITYLPDFDFYGSVVLAIADSSHAGEEEWIDP